MRGCQSITDVVCLFGAYGISSDRNTVGDDLGIALRADDSNRPVLDLSGLQFADSCLVQRPRPGSSHHYLEPSTRRASV
jgi:hypothetical protein